MTDTDPFAQFKDTFFTECDELMSDMERSLTDLQEGQDDSETLNAIFRAVHSIKAGAGTFKFDNLVQFSHTFEALLDKLRSGELKSNDAIVNTLFAANDILADLIDAARNEENLEENYGKNILDEMDGFLKGSNGVVDKKEQAEAIETGPESEENASLYLINFKPDAEIFRNANEPILLIRELKTLGEVYVKVDYSRLPKINIMEPEDSYLSWTMILRGAVKKEDVEEVFEFVEDNCDLEIKLMDDDQSNLEDTEFSELTEKLKSLLPDNSNIADAQEMVDANDEAVTKLTQSKSVQPTKASKVTSIRVDIDRVDKLVNMVGELVITQAMLTQDVENLDASQNMRLISGMEELASHARELQDNVMAVRMQPVKSVFMRMPRLVRDLSGQLNKKVKLITTGESTEVDKTVIEELADPLTHMIRNSLDHGIESPEIREKAGKNPEGVIQLSAEHRGGRIIIEVSDDGQGINREVVLKKAREKKLVGPEDLSDEEIDNLIFHPGFSTAAEVTNVSGRGVGMDVVRRNILSLGGRISVKSEAGKGSKFTLSLPLTLAVLDGMIVGVGSEKYVIPVNSIIESVRPNSSEVMKLPGDTSVVRIRGEYIPLIPTGELFATPGAELDPTKALVVIVETDGGNQAGIVVDHLIGQQQVVIKSLETNYQAIEGISAATILGNGQVCLIVDIDGLERMDRSRRCENTPSYSLDEPFEPTEHQLLQA